MLRSFTIALVMLCASCATSTAPPKSGTKVVALGVGSTLEMAKLEAIRSALSKTIPQYVVVDRQIIDDEVKKDIVTSTMNGYVSDVEILDQYTDDNGFVNVTVEVGVSERKIRDFKRDSVPMRIRLAGCKLTARTSLKASRDNVQSTKQSVDGVRSNGLPLKRCLPDSSQTTRRQPPRWRSPTSHMTPKIQILYITYAYDLNEEWRRKFWQKARTIDRLIADSERVQSLRCVPPAG